MNMRFAVSILGLATMAMAVPDTVLDFDVAAAMGRWYEYSTTPFAKLSFEKDCTCVTATYSIINATHVNVYNGNNLMAPGENTDNCIDGYATTTNVTGRLLVFLDGVPFAGDYWVVRTLLRDGETEYFYMVVTDPPMSTLFVLTRDLADFSANYADEILAWAETEGYTDPDYNLPVIMEHTEACVYPPIPVPECTDDNNNFPTPTPPNNYYYNQQH